MQGNTTEIDERNLLRLDALLSHGYGLSPQLVMRSKGLSIEAKALYGYLSSFAGAGDTAFPSTSRILEELDISKNRFYVLLLHLFRGHFLPFCSRGCSESCIYVDLPSLRPVWRGHACSIQYHQHTAAQGTDWASQVLQSEQPTECKRRKRCRRLQ